MIYKTKELTLSDTMLVDSLGTITWEQIPEGDPGCGLLLKDPTPLMSRLWQRALADVMSNHVEVDGLRYLGAGAKFGIKVFTRDIAYSGILGVNRTHPDMMRESLRFTRELRLKLGLKVSTAYAGNRYGFPFEVLDMDDETFTSTYNTNGFVRRTDDVIWLWAYHDLLGASADAQELTWLFETGTRCFQELYNPFFDPEDGLYWGQASFVDIHFPSKGIQTSGYPHDWGFDDCLHLKATCTNALYQQGLRVMADLAERLQLPSASDWSSRAEKHREAMREGLRDERGRFSYYKRADGSLEPRRSALGTALAILAQIVDREEAEAALAEYPHTCFGIPLLDPPREGDEFSYYHNRASWPFVDALFCWAEQQVTGENTCPYAAAIAARTCRPDGTFHEVVRLPDGDVRCSSSQLWSAAGFINTCLRAGWVDAAT